MASRLYDPLAKVETEDALAEIVCLEVDGKLTLQIVNALGAHTNPRSVTETHIPPLESVTFSVREDKPIKKIIMQPEGLEILPEHRGGRAYFTVPRVDIHSVAQIIFD
jgi:hypothetical protein